MLGLFVLAFIFNFNLVRAQERTTTTIAPTATETKEGFFVRARRAITDIFTPTDTAKEGQTFDTITPITKTDTRATETTTSGTTPTAAGTSGTKAVGGTLVTVDTKIPVFTGNCQTKQTEIAKKIEESNLSALRKVSAKRWLRLWFLQCLRGQSIDPGVYLKAFTTRGTRTSDTSTLLR